MKKIFTLVAVILMVMLLVPAVIAAPWDINLSSLNHEVCVDSVGADYDLFIRKTGGSWGDEVELAKSEMTSAKVDFKCALDTQIIKNTIIEYYTTGLNFAKSFMSEDAAKDLMRGWPVTGEFVVKIVYPSILDVPAAYTEDAKTMYGFNDEAKILFEETGRTCVADGDNMVLTITIAIKDMDGVGTGIDGVAEQTLYENIDTYLEALVFTVENVGIKEKFSDTLEITGELCKGKSYTMITLGSQAGEDDRVDFYTNVEKVWINPKTTTINPGTGSSKTYKVTFNVDGDTTMVDPIYTTGLVKYSNLTYPSKVGYVFDGWYFDSTRLNKVTADFSITKNIVLYGHLSSKIVNDYDHFAYVIGYPDEHVRPLRNITREEVATIFYRLLQDEVRDSLRVNTNDFTDVASDRWSIIEISTMANGGFIKGYPDGTFRPGEPITRAEFATMATRFAGLFDQSGASFTDIAGHWSEPYVLKAATAGWVAGYPDGTFLPDQLITRAEAMTIINRVLKRSVNAEGLHADTRFWIDMKGDEWYYYIVLEATNTHDFTRQADGINENWTAIRPNKDWHKSAK